MLVGGGGEVGLGLKVGVGGERFVSIHYAVACFEDFAHLLIFMRS